MQCSQDDTSSFMLAADEVVIQLRAESPHMRDEICLSIRQFLGEDIQVRPLAALSAEIFCAAGKLMLPLLLRSARCASWALSEHALPPRSSLLCQLDQQGATPPEILTAASRTNRSRSCLRSVPPCQPGHAGSCSP
jgi:hypothetical protein